MAKLVNRSGRIVDVSDDRVPALLGVGFKPAPEPFDLTTLTVAQLKEYAGENNIDLGDATRKTDILTALGVPPEVT